MNLAEIIEEGETRLRNARLAGEFQTRDRRIRQAEAESFAVEHFARLLAVARAAVECERDPWGGGFTALRAAVRGEEENG